MGDSRGEIPSLFTSSTALSGSCSSLYSLRLDTSPGLYQQKNDSTKQAVPSAGNFCERCGAEVVRPTEAEASGQTQQLLSDLHLKVSALNTENDNLKKLLTGKSQQLKELREVYEHKLKDKNHELELLQRLHEETAQELRGLKQKEWSWQEERQRLERTISTLQKQLDSMNWTARTECHQRIDETDGLPIEVSVKGNNSSDELLNLYKHLISLKNVIMDQRRVIEELRMRKTPQKQPQGEGDNSNKDLLVSETTPVYCQHDLDKEKADQDHNLNSELVDNESTDYSRQIRINSRARLLSVPNPLYQPPILNRRDDVMPRIGDDLRSRIAYPPDDGMHHIGMPTGRSRSRLESNVNSCETGATSRHRQTRELFLADATSRHRQTRELFLADATSRLAVSQWQTDDCPVRECPSCGMLVSPEVSQQDFEDHVYSHYELDFEVLEK